MSMGNYMQNTKADNSEGSCFGNVLLEYIVDSHDDCVVICTPGTFRIVSLNVAAAKFLSTSKSEALGRDLFSIMPVDFSADYREEFSSLISDSGKVVEHILSLRDDSTYNLKASRLGDNIMLVIKNAVGRTEHFEETNFRMLFENMSSGFVFLKAVSDEAGKIINHQILDVNSTFEIFFNVDRNAVLGRNITDVIAGLDDTWVRILAKSANKGYSYSGNYHYAKKNKHFEVRTYSPRKGFSAAVFNDIKQEMEIRNDLIIKSEISKAFAIGHDTSVYSVVLELVLKNTGSSYGFIGYVVPGGKVLYLARVDDKLSVTVDVHGDEMLPIEPGTTVGKSYESRKQEAGMNVDGHSLVLSTPVLDDMGNVIGFIGSADPDGGYGAKARNFVQSLADYISPLMRSEIKERNYRRELVEAKERAEANERLKTTFLANISHEIRTPMNGICGFSELLAKSGNLSPKQHKFVDIIIKSTKQLLHIVEDIMDMSKLQTQQAKVNLSAVNINKMLDEVYVETLQMAQEKHLSLDVYTTLSDEEATIETDYYKAKKIITCLVSNGIKFTNIGGVSFGYNLEGDCITFFVEDTGIGIRKELHDGIFSSFRQAENAMERKYNGAGVGLSISKGFVDLLGGQIWLNSSPDKGSTFYVKFKYCKA